MSSRKAYYDKRRRVWLLPLTQGAVALIDACDAEWSSQWLWQFHAKTDGRPKPYRAAIRVEGTLHHLGFYSTLEEATAMYMKHVHRFQGDFCRKDFVR